MDLGLSFLKPLALQQDMEQQAAKQPFDLQHLQSLSRLQNAQAQEAEMKVEGEKKAAALMQQMSGITPQGTAATGSDASFHRAQAAAYSAAGLMAKAAEARKNAAMVEYREALIEASKNRSNHLTQQDRMARLKWVAEHSGSINDQKSWEDMNALYSQEFKEDNPLANLPYSPEFVKSLHSMAMTEQQKANLSMQQQRLQVSKANLGARLANDADLKQRRAVENEYTRAVTERTRDKKAADGKAGGRDIGAPSSTEIKLAEQLLLSDRSLGMDDTTRAQAAADLAAQARAKRNASRGAMSHDEALRQSLAEQKARGDYITHTKPTMFGFGTEKKETEYKHGGEAKPSVKLEPNKVYVDANGKKMRWTGKDWVEP